MRTIAELVKSLLTGGLLFLLPLGVVIVIVEKLLKTTRGLGLAMQKWLVPGMQSEAAVLAFTVLILVAAALLAGLFARTRAGERTFSWFEKVLLSRLPFYTLVRQVIPDTDSQPLGEYRKTPVVTVRLDDQFLVGLLVDTLPDGRKIVYLPSAPTALSGSIAIMEPGRVEEADIQPRELLAGLRRLGTGMAKLAQK